MKLEKINHATYSVPCHVTTLDKIGGRVEPGSYPPGAPTDPDVPN